MNNWDKSCIKIVVRVFFNYCYPDKPLLVAISNDKFSVFHSCGCDQILGTKENAVTLVPQPFATFCSVTGG